MVPRGSGSIGVGAMGPKYRWCRAAPPGYARRAMMEKRHTWDAKIDGVVKFEPVSRQKRRISVYPVEIAPIGGGPLRTAPIDVTAAAD